MTTGTPIYDPEIALLHIIAEALVENGVHFAGLDYAPSPVEVAAIIRDAIVAAGWPRHD